MSRSIRRGLSHPVFMGLLFAALALRGLIPMGYMPSQAQPLALELCRAGLPAAAVHSDDADSGSDAQSRSALDSTLCVFGMAQGAAPVPEFHPPTIILAELSVVGAPPAVDPTAIRRQRAVQPRAPPAFS